jgi:hypothetical protein
MPQSQLSIQLLQLPTMHSCLAFFLGSEYYSFVNTSHTAMGWQNLPPYHFPPTSIWRVHIPNSNVKWYSNSTLHWISKSWPTLYKNVLRILLKPSWNKSWVFIIWKRTYIAYPACVAYVVCFSIIQNIGA